MMLSLTTALLKTSFLYVSESWPNLVFLQLLERLRVGFRDNSANPEDIRLLLQRHVQLGRIRYWNQLTVWHRKLDGVQRLRCYPFKSTSDFQAEQFHLKNQQDVVAFIPSWLDSGDVFQYPSGRRPDFEIGRVNLFFNFTFTPDPDIKDQEGKKLESFVAKSVFFTYFDRYAEMAGGQKPLHYMERPAGGARRRRRIGTLIVLFTCLMFA